MNILVVSPHPDDETLGAGGTIFRMLAEGHKVYWLNITGVELYGAITEEEKILVKKQVIEIGHFYGYTEIFNLNFPTTKLDTIESSIAISKISEIIKKVKPNWIILPDYNDAHSDHKYVFDWCFASSKVFRFPYINKILTMEVPSETNFGRPEQPFHPNLFIDITQYINNKLMAMQIYKSELKEHPFPRSVDAIYALATLRGSMAGVKYAEAFKIIKEII